MQSIAFNFETGNLMKYLGRWYGYGPDTDTAEPAQHMMQRLLQSTEAAWSNGWHATTKLTLTTHTVELPDLSTTVVYKTV